MNENNKVCSNHGICVKISKGNSYSNWDKDSTYGCKCDEGYKGSDCSVSIIIIIYYLYRKMCWESWSNENIFTIKANI